MSIPAGASRDPETAANISSTKVAARSKDVAAYGSKWVSGLDRTVAGTTFTLKAPGVAVVNGRRLALSSDHPETLTDNARNYVWWEESKNVAVNTTGTAPSAGALLLWEVELAAGSVVGEADRREDRIDYGDTLIEANGFDAKSQKIVNVANGTAATDGVNKSQAEAIATQLGGIKPVRVATTANITLSGTPTIDGVALSAGDRVLAKNQSTGSQNGIWVVAAGSWSRATDFNSATTVKGGSIVSVSEGTANAHSSWILTTDDPITPGTTPMAFALHSVQGQRGTSAGLATLTGGVHTAAERPSATTSVKGDALVGTATPAAVSGTAAAVGASTTRWAREDHVHLLPDDLVTFAKMQNITSDRLIGRDTPSSGDPEEVSVGGGIEFTGAGGIRTSAFTGDVTKTAGGTAQTIANNAVTNAKAADMATQRIKGRTTAGTGDPEDLTPAQVVAMLAAADGPGSGLDADTVDGIEGAKMLRTDVTKEPDVDNAINIGSALKRIAHLYAVNVHTGDFWMSDTHCARTGLLLRERHRLGFEVMEVRTTDGRRELRTIPFIIMPWWKRAYHGLRRLAARLGR